MPPCGWRCGIPQDLGPFPILACDISQLGVRQQQVGEVQSSLLQGLRADSSRWRSVQWVSEAVAPISLISCSIW